MAKILGLEIKNVKFLSDYIKADLYINDNKIGYCKYSGENSGQVFLKCNNNIDIRNINIIIADYFKKYHKCLPNDSMECKVTEILKDLLSLHENEQCLIRKKVDYPKAKIIHISYNKRAEVLESDSDWLCITNWSGNLKDRINNNYKNVKEMVIYNEEKDFIIN